MTDITKTPATDVLAPHGFWPRRDWQINKMKCKSSVIPIKEDVVQIIADQVQEATGIDPFHETKYRGREFVVARQLFFYMVLKHTKWTIAKIGEILRKDHATVIHARRVICDLKETDRDFRGRVAILDNKISVKLKRFDV